MAKTSTPRPDRRAVLTSGAAAALIASTAAAVSAVDPDAGLLALRPQWLRIRADMDALHDRRAPADMPAFTAKRASMPSPANAASVEEYWSIRKRRRELRKELPPSIEEGEAEAQAKEDRLAELCREEDRLIDILVERPAQTPAGLAFKAEVHLWDDMLNSELSLSVAIDAINLGRKLTGAKA